MQLVGSDGSVELTLVGYQFPHLATAPWDSNWLIVRVRVQHPRGNWSAQDPCLLTYDVAGLADWLEAVAVGREDDAELGFMEPNLLFRTGTDSHGSRFVRVCFDLELRPDWARSDEAETEDLFLDFPADPTQLTAAARSLREQLARYPQRTER
jgi:hypothetical protein